jgi:hypothetical protein
VGSADDLTESLMSASVWLVVVVLLGIPPVDSAQKTVQVQRVENERQNDKKTGKNQKRRKSFTGRKTACRANATHPHTEP